jgi:bacterioferritin
MLQSVLATELVCVLRYTMHAISATGISSEGVKKEFAAHAREENEHVHQVAERINQLGGKPNFDPKGLESILVVEEEHANDMHDLLVAREGTPMLK